MRFPKHEVPERVLDIFIDALREGENLEPEFDRLVATNGKSADLNKRLAKLSAACRDRIVNQTLLIIEDSRLDRLSWSWVRDRLLALLSLPLAPVTVRRIVRLPGIMLASGHLWAMMEKLAPENPVLEDALARLGEWRTLADDAPKAKRQACFNAYPMD